MTLLLPASLVIVGGSPCWAQAEPANDEEIDALTGNWGGGRNYLLSRGVDLGLAYTGDVWGNVAGGLEQGIVYLDNWDLTLALDAEALMGWKGGSFFFYFLGNQFGSPSDLVGDHQAASNIDAPDTFKLYEAWLEQRFGSVFSIRAGLYDLNSEFDANEVGGLFINSSQGIGPDFSQAGENGPSIFPNASLGLRLRLDPTPWLYAQAAVLDGVPGDPDRPKALAIRFDPNDGALIAVEVGVAPASAKAQAHFALGGWHYTARFDHLTEIDATGNPLRLRANRGAYLIVEAWGLGEVDDPDQGLGVLLRLGLANAQVNPFLGYTGGAIRYTGLIPGRDADQIGLGVAAVHNGKFMQETMQADDPRTEIAIEFSAAIELTPWWILHPDVQFIIHPGTAADVQNALLLGLRTEVVF